MTAADLSPDLVQRIVMYMANKTDVASLLLVLPPALLSAPLTALRTLFRALFDGELAGTTRDGSMHLSLWPTLVLPNPHAINKPILINALQAASSLFASLTIPSSTNIPWGLPPHLSIELPGRIDMAQDVFSRLALWDTRLSLVSIYATAYPDDWTRADIEKLATLLPTPSRLGSLDLFCEGDCTFEIGLVLHAVFASRSLTQLSLTTNVWSDDIGRAFAEWLATVPVSSLKLRGRHRMQPHAHALAHAIRSCRTLRSLALGDTAIVRAFVAAPLPAHLTKLDLGLDLPTVVDETVDEISKAVASHPHLEALSIRLDFWWVHPLGSVLLAQCLPTLRRLRRLDLANLTLHPTTRAALWTVLPRLTELLLEKNGLGDDGVAEIAAVLPTCHRLRRLALVDQDISDVGVIAIARSLPLCPSLTDLNLTDNVIESNGAMALWPLLPHLTKLSLRHNFIGNDAAMALSEVLRSSAHMRVLDMSNNNVGLPAVRAIFIALQGGTYRAGVVKVSVANGDYDAACSCALECLRDPHWVDITRQY